QCLRYFQKDGDEWIVNPDVRRQIEFRRLNLMDNLPGLGPFDMILCRNVLIYFDAATRKRLCQKFHELLIPGGLLILGSAESLYGVSTDFASEQIGSTMAFRKSAS
ncbi:MAG: hypothetical protein EHM42_03600, partial [Planctomycetaceae bacterium]